MSTVNDKQVSKLDSTKETEDPTTTLKIFQKLSRQIHKYKNKCTGDKERNFL